MNPQNKPKQTMVKPDKACVNTWYTFSINPCDDFQFFKERLGSDRIKKARNHMEYVLRQYPNIHIVLYIDVSSAGRIHWHGTILFPKLQSIRDFYTEMIHELLTKHTVEMDTIKEAEVWDAYCTKTIPLWDVRISTEQLVMKKAIDKTPRLQKSFDDY